MSHTTSFISPDLIMTRFDGSRPVAVVSYDAGGAEVVSSYIKRNTLECNYHLAGPAVEIFTKKLGPLPTNNLQYCLEKSEWLLCSMGWSDLEWQAVSRAKEMNKHVAVFLDHWTGYESRFERNGEFVLPDELWVGDVAAEKLAHKAFPDIPVKLVPNPYYADLRDELSSMPALSRSVGSGIRILYVCEPTAPVTDSLKSSGYTDHAALKYFFEYLTKSNENIESISLRPHPKEANDKYAWALRNDSMKATLSTGRELLADIWENDWVVGRNSMALVVAAIAGKKVFSCIPPGGKPCTLPCDEIIHIGLQMCK